MTEDRLYRLTIPGANFLFLLAGWLIVDPNISLLAILHTLKLEGSSSLTVMALGGGLILVTAGYLCGEICFALGIPNPRLSNSPAGDRVDDGLASGVIWLSLLILMLLLALIGVIRVTVVSSSDWTGVVLLLFMLHGVVNICTTLFRATASLRLDGHCDKFFPRVVAVDRQAFNLEMISLYTHMRIAAISEETHRYLTRAWSRVVIGAHSICATLLALLAYSLIKVICIGRGGAWLREIVNVGDTIAPNLIDVYLCLNCLLIFFLYMSIRRQLDHRRRLYAVLLNCDIEALTRVPKD